LLRNAEETKISLQTLQLVMKHGFTVVTHKTKQQPPQWKTHYYPKTKVILIS